MDAQREFASLPVRRATCLLAVLVAAFVPAMQIIVDRTWPVLTKPTLAGLAAGLIIASCCLLNRQRNLRLWAMCTMLLLTLALAEGLCALLLGPVSSSIYDWDDHTLYHTVPNARKIYRRTALNGGDRIETSINSLGFRGPEFAVRSQLPRVMVYGDSFIEAEYSQLEQTFVQRLQRGIVERLSHPVEVINAGTNGFGPDQILRRMEQELPRFKPQVVILSIFADNDLGDLLRNKLYRLNEQGHLVDHTWQRAPHCLHPGLTGRYEPALWRLARNAIRGLQSQGGMVESYMERWRLQCVREYDEYIVQGDPVVHDLQADHYDADVSLTPGCASAVYKARLFAEVLDRIRLLCNSHDSRLLVMIIPSPADLIEGYDFCRIDHQRYPDYQHRAITDVVQKACDKLQIEVVNLFDDFAKSDARQLYFRGGDNHWNDLGQQQAAAYVAPRVVELLKASP